MSNIKKKTFHFTVLFFEICLTYDGLVSKALPLRTSSPGRFFYIAANKIKHGFIASESITTPIPVHHYLQVFNT